jgi:hypothetical protein
MLVPPGFKKTGHQTFDGSPAAQLANERDAEHRAGRENGSGQWALLCENHEVERG